MRTQKMNLRRKNEKPKNFGQTKINLVELKKGRELFLRNRHPRENLTPALNITNIDNTLNACSNF